MGKASEPPKRLFLQWGNPGESPGSVDASDVTWSGSRVFPGDVEYVRADLAAAATARAEKAERDREHFRDALRRIFNMIPGTDSEVKQYAIDVLADYEEAQAALEGGDDA